MNRVEARKGGLFRTDNRSKGETYSAILERAGMGGKPEASPEPRRNR